MPDDLLPRTVIKPIGYAAAVSPPSASAINTDLAGITGGMISLTAADGSTLPAYAAAPEKAGPNGDGPHPVVLVVQEIFGVHEYIKDTCRRLAKLGYIAIAPELYVRQGDPTAIADIPTLFTEIVSQVPDAQVFADLDTCLDWALANGGDAARVGITGFCWGGRVTWLYAAHSDRLKAGVAWYGKVEPAVAPLQPVRPIDVAAALKAPVLGLYGGEDHGIPLDGVERMKAALSGASVDTDIIVFPTAGHAFHADYRPSYDAAIAADGWSKMLAWFAAHGVGE